VHVSHVHRRKRGVGGTKERDRRTIPERMATYFLTAISLANWFSPGSTNEVEAAGLSETATTIPLRKPGDDIPRPESSTVVERGKEGRKEEGGKGFPDSPYPLEGFSGKTKNCGLAERRGLTQNETKVRTRWPHVRPKCSFLDPASGTPRRKRGFGTHFGNATLSPPCDPELRIS